MRMRIASSRAMIIAIKMSVPDALFQLSPPQLRLYIFRVSTRGQRRRPNAYYKHCIIGREFNRQQAKRNRRPVKRHRASGSRIRTLKSETISRLHREPVSKYFQERAPDIPGIPHGCFFPFGLLPNSSRGIKNYFLFKRYDYVHNSITVCRLFKRIYFDQCLRENLTKNFPRFI